MDDESFTSFLAKNNKMAYRKDGFDLTVALPFAFQAEVRRRHWETFRTGYMAVEFSGNILHTYEDGLGHIVLQKPLVQLKSLQIFENDPEGQKGKKLKKDMSGVASAIFGIINILIKQFAPPEIVYPSFLNLIPGVDPQHFVLSH